MIKKRKIITQIENGLIVGLLTYFAYFLTTFYWQLNEISEFELIMLSVISGLFLLLISPIYLFFSLKKFYRNLEENLKPKKRYFIALIMITSIITFILLDCLVFLIDNSLSKEYLDYLNSLEPNSEIDTILPMSILNIVPFIMFGLLSYITSVLIVKKK